MSYEADKDHYGDLADALPRSSRRVYEYWLGKGRSPAEAYYLARAAFDDEAEYQRLKGGSRKHGR